MARLSELVETFAGFIGADPAEIAWMARRLREAGVLPKNPVGRLRKDGSGKLDATAEHAAALLCAALIASKGEGAVDAVNLAKALRPIGITEAKSINANGTQASVAATNEQRSAWQIGVGGSAHDRILGAIKAARVGGWIVQASPEIVRLDFGEHMLDTGEGPRVFTGLVIEGREIGGLMPDPSKITYEHFGSEVSRPAAHAQRLRSHSIPGIVIGLLADALGPATVNERESANLLERMQRSPNWREDADVQRRLEWLGAHPDEPFPEGDA